MYKYKIIYRLLKTPEEVLKAGKYMVACQLSREPLIRKCLRETFFDRAKINVVPTKAGIKEIDENHNCYSLVFYLFFINSHNYKFTIFNFVCFCIE